MRLQHIIGLGCLSSIVATVSDGYAVCASSVLPSVVCTSGDDPSTTACCIDLATVDPNALESDSSKLCDQRHYWDMFSPLLDANSRSQHNWLYGVRVNTFTGWPAAATDGGSTWAKYLVATRLLGGVLYRPGITWHDSILDYTQVVRGFASGYHSDHTSTEVQAIEGAEANSSSRMEYGNPFVFDDLLMGCGHFGFTPIKQAAVVLHENWHQVYGGHDDDNRDMFWRRRKSDILPGNMTGRFTALNANDSITDFAQQSVYQTEAYFIAT